MKTESPLVSIIIVTHNGDRVVTECLDSINALKWSAREVIVVDNASSDETIKQVSKVIPTARTIRLPVNKGYGGGANVGSRAAKGEILLFVNQDVSLDERFLDGIVDRMTRDDSIGVCGGIIIAWDSSWLVSAGQIFERWSGYGLDFGFGSPNLSLRRTTEEVFSPNGAVFAVRRETFSRIGGFDEDLFMYFDETDLAWRARLTGFRVTCCPDSIARHRIDLERAHSAWPRYYIDRNSLLSATRNYEFRNLAFFLPIALAVRISGVLALILLRREEHAMSMARAVSDFFVYFPRAWRKRREGPTIRKLADREVMKREVLASPLDVLKALSSSLLPSTDRREETKE